MSKGVATRYIVALILAVAVIAVVAYMFFTHTGIFSGVVTEKYCEAKKMEFCFKCDLGENPTWSDLASECKSLSGFENLECKDC